MNCSRLFVDYVLNLKPSHYEYLLPLYDRAKLDELSLTGVFPSIRDLSSSLLVALTLGISRLFLTYILIKPFAIWVLDIKFRDQVIDPEIESLLKSKGHPRRVQDDDVLDFCKEVTENPSTGCNRIRYTESRVHEYLWNVRHNSSAEMKIVKFVEAFWRFLFYSYFCFVGYRILFIPVAASWVLDTKEHWQDWPLQEAVPLIMFYYKIELGAYIHQIMWTEVSRSDSVEMMVHHVATILLLLGSYLTNFTRIGASILLLHDCTDVLLESAKIFNYISKAKGGKWACTVCDTLFALFAVSFAVTRLILYPRYLLYSLLYEAPAILGIWPGYPVFAALLLVLQGLHIFWFYLILRMIPSLLSTGIQKDERSDDEMETVKPTKKGEDTKIDKGRQTGKVDSKGRQTREDRQGKTDREDRDQEKIDRQGKIDNKG